MPIGKLVFAQLMDFLPLHTFRRCVARYPSNYPTKTFSHLDQYLSMAFAQLTFRESLRDIEVCLRAHEAKLYHLGIRGHVARSNLGDANEKRDWRIYRDFANSLIAQARRLYADDAFAVDLDNTVYALDTTTIDLSLKVFPWAHFRKAKAAVKMHTQIDLRGNIPSFIHVGRNGFAEASWVKAGVTWLEVSLGLAGVVLPRRYIQPRETTMSPLRARMIEDMILAGLAEGTRQSYVLGGPAADCVLPARAGPAQRGGRAPLPAGSAPARGGARHVPDRAIRAAVLLLPHARSGLGAVRGKKGSPRRGRSGCLRRWPRSRSGACSAASAIRSTGRA